MKSSHDLLNEVGLSKKKIVDESDLERKRAKREEETLKRDKLKKKIWKREKKAKKKKEDKIEEEDFAVPTAKSKAALTASEEFLALKSEMLTKDQDKQRAKTKVKELTPLELQRIKYKWKKQIENDSETDIVDWLNQFKTLIKSEKSQDNNWMHNTLKF